jgi:hypothetical protein
MGTTLTTPCGRIFNAKGRPYKHTLDVLRHISTCADPECIRRRDIAYDSVNFEVEIDDDDMPDGAYWALQSELFGDEL